MNAPGERKECGGHFRDVFVSRRSEDEMDFGFFPLEKEIPQTQRAFGIVCTFEESAAG